MEKKHYFNSVWKNKKAFIFTMDVAVALSIAALFFVTSLAFVSNSEDTFPNLQLIKYGTDVIRVLHYRGFLTNPTAGQISNLVPDYYGMQISGYDSCRFNPVGDTPPNDRFIASAKYYFESTNGFCYVRYKIWVK